MILEGPLESNASILRIPRKQRLRCREAARVALAARRLQRTRTVFEKLSSQAAKDGAQGSAVPGNSHGAGAPSRGNAGAGKGSRRSRQGAPALAERTPEPAAFFVLLPYSHPEGFGWRRPSRTGVGEGAER